MTRAQKTDTHSGISRRVQAYVVTDVWIWDVFVGLV